MASVNPCIVYSDYDVPADYTASYAFSPVEPLRQSTFMSTTFVLLFVILLLIKITDSNFFVKIEERKLVLNDNAGQRITPWRSDHMPQF